MSTGPEGETSIKGIDVSQIGNFRNLPSIPDLQERFLESVKHPISIYKPIGEVFEGHQTWNLLYGPKDPKNP